MIISILYIWAAGDRLSLDRKLKNNVEETAPGKLIKYNGVFYNITPLQLLEFDYLGANTNEKYTTRGFDFISWTGSRLFYINCYFLVPECGDNLIYESTGDYIYLKQDYNYMLDEYKIFDESEHVVLNDFLKETDYEVPLSAPANTLTTVTFKSVSYSKIGIELDFIYENEKYYAYTNRFKAYEVSDSFIKQLEEKGKLFGTTQATEGDSSKLPKKWFLSEKSFLI